MGEVEQHDEASMVDEIRRLGVGRGKSGKTGKK